MGKTGNKAKWTYVFGGNNVIAVVTPQTGVVGHLRRRDSRRPRTVSHNKECVEAKCCI
jgi:hypothetical protein